MEGLGNDGIGVHGMKFPKNQWKFMFNKKEIKKEILVTS